jgi:hypothetical protein
MKLELSLEEINIIMAALGNMPYAQVAGLVDKVRGQVQPQLQKPEEV